jgi:hypothetical protein
LKKKLIFTNRKNFLCVFFWLWFDCDLFVSVFFVWCVKKCALFCDDVIFEKTNSAYYSSWSQNFEFQINCFLCLIVGHISDWLISHITFFSSLSACLLLLLCVLPARLQSKIANFGRERAAFLFFALLSFLSISLVGLLLSIFLVYSMVWDSFMHWLYFCCLLELC